MAQETGVPEHSQKVASKEITVDLNDLYKIEPGNTILNMSESFYSNLAVANVSNADIRIDFLQVPGINKDGKSIIDARRIVLSHGVAQRLAEILINTLEKAYESGKMDQYIPADNSDEES